MVTPRDHARVQVRQRAAQHARLQPARQRGGLPVLGLLGQPRRRDDLQHPGRPRPDPPRPGAGLLLRRSGSLEQVEQANPQLQTLIELLNAPRQSDVCPTADAMIKQAPSIGRILTMVAFALSCVGLLLYLWLTFGGSIPLRPEGYRMHVKFPEATSLAQEADVRISGVNVGKVKIKEQDKRDRPDRRRDRARRAATRRSRATRRRSCARRRCWARPTSS